MYDCNKTSLKCISKAFVFVFEYLSFIQFYVFTFLNFKYNNIFSLYPNQIQILSFMLYIVMKVNFTQKYYKWKTKRNILINQCQSNCVFTEYHYRQTYNTYYTLKAILFTQNFPSNKAC